MENIRTISTAGMDLAERRELLSRYAPIPLGETVFRAGDAWGVPEKVVVTDENQKMITMFWNSLYFDDFLLAERKTIIAHAEYGSWQALQC